MAITITQAVVSKFAASGNTDFSASGGLHFDEIPENVDLPFLGFFHAGETTKYTFEREYFDQGSFQFTVFAITVAEAERLAKVVMAIYDACVMHPQGELAITAEKCIAWGKTDYKITTATYRDQPGNVIGEATFGYEYRVQKTLP
jgi:hypothetical protein